MRRPWWQLVVVLMLVTCGPVSEFDGGFGDLDAGAGLDAGASIDAGELDAGLSSDAGVEDAGAPADAGEVPDAGITDGGELDAGVADAGEGDAGLPDAGEADAGEPDAGSVDAGESDAGATDAGSSDAGVLPEQCADGVDNDGDLQIDCDDADCQLSCAGACNAPQQLVSSVTLGSTAYRTNRARASCDFGSDVGRDVVYAFMASTAGTLTVQLTPSFDGIVSLRTTCGTAATEVACSDNAPANSSEIATMSVTAGQTVFIFVDTFNSAVGGPFSLSVSLQ